MKIRRIFKKVKKLFKRRSPAPARLKTKNIKLVIQFREGKDTFTFGYSDIPSKWRAYRMFPKFRKWYHRKTTPYYSFRSKAGLTTVARNEIIGYYIREVKK